MKYRIAEIEYHKYQVQAKSFLKPWKNIGYMYSHPNWAMAYNQAATFIDRLIGKI